MPIKSLGARSSWRRRQCCIQPPHACPGLRCTSVAERIVCDALAGAGVGDRLRSVTAPQRGSAHEGVQGSEMHVAHAQMAAAKRQAAVLDKYVYGLVKKGIY